ncbi:MAG: 16S rRNA (guanine(527)-N(7))-methyltransferase [uncultured Solirubrobacteraceae bacterium]|uniref:Ribosomal RNA small subunit methyltransferase G n=1 Tax=uncultured Solirubrobacteraceae bacterium TaxID=1162706 RepID=A0A6J4SUJ9_9ACTN|nr:MAG: 16S rRNA (guanine(527)-N(7))-methyltransferase [uncultured Solirubrobacteraceae bacterium]
MSALRTRIARLGEEYGLPEVAGRQLRALLDAVERDPVAPTTVTDPARGVEAHIADSLAGLRLSAVRDARVIADVGAGAGFPGLVLAAALPGARARLVDSVAKKCDFVRRAAAAAGLENVEVVHARAEDWPGGLERHDLVTARAVAPLAVVVEYAAPLLQLDGRLVAWKGLRDPREEADGRAAAAATGLEATEIVAVPPRRGAEHRHLHVYTKLSPTPAKFPRRPGMARKRPIVAPS